MAFQRSDLNELMMIERKINRAKESSEFESEQEKLNYLDDLQRKKVNILNTLDDNIKIKKDFVLLSDSKNIDRIS